MSEIPANVGRNAPTVQDVYTEVVRLGGRVEGALGQLSAHGDVLTSLDARLRTLEVAYGRAGDTAAESAKSQLDHETRLRKLEAWRYAMPIASVAALLSGAAAIIAAVGAT